MCSKKRSRFATSPAGMGGGMAWFTLLMAGGMVCVVSPVGAQSTRSTTRVTVTTTRPPLQGACAAFMNGPMELARSPEGMALLRFKREVEGVANVFEARAAQVDDGDARRMVQVQRGIDSLINVFVRYRTADGGPMIMIRKGDSTVTGEYRVEKRLFDNDAWVSRVRPDGEGRSNIEVTLRALEPQVAAVASAGARVVARGTPAGYIGVGLSGSQMRLVTDSGSFTAHCDYPLIETVDVGSPARRAGLGAGDTIIAYNGRDVVAQAVNYPQLLSPGKVVRVRIKRDGKLREMPVTVAERSADVADAESREHVRVIEVAPLSRAMQPFAFWRGWSTEDGQRTPTPRAASSGSPGAVTVQGSANGAGSVAGGATMAVVLGAQLSAVDDEFAQSSGLEPGVLVMRVEPGSPAADAGLRPGEMIRAVNGTPVRVLLPIQRAVSAPSARDVKLTVSARDTPPRIVTIRW